MGTRREPRTLEERVLKFIREKDLVKAGQKLLVAVSGGPDSVCLLYTLYQLQKELDIKLHIAHLNHQLRGEESAADARYVEEVARKLNLPYTLEKADIAAYRAGNRLSLEEAAREVRYDFLARVAQAIGTDRVAVGHTLDDQVETVLLHIIRGTGTQGLRGLQPLHQMQFAGNRLTIIRPLLETSREETEELCSRLQLTPCSDTSNLSLSFLRNRVRRELLPLLRQNYNPGIRESLLRLRRIAEDEMAFLDAESVKTWRKVVQKEHNAIIFDKARLRQLSPALQRHLLRRAINELLGTLKDIETRHIEEIMEGLKKPAGRRITLPGGLVFSIEYDRFLLAFNPEEMVPFPELKGAFELKLSGETRIPGWHIESRSVSRRHLPDNLDQGTGDGFTACFDKDRIGDKIILRARRRGDWFQPLGLGRPKKVGEFMLDARIPRAWRDRIPIICTPEQIIWVAGWRIDERVKVVPDTRRVLCLRVERWQNERSGGSRENR